jgi:hypothetical protein
MAAYKRSSRTPNPNPKLRTCTLAVMGPAVATVLSTFAHPCELQRPLVGFSPTTPQKEAGMRMDPPPSVPVHREVCVLRM